MNKTEELKLDYLTMNLINKINDLYYLIKKDINDDKKDLRLTMKYTIKDLEDNIRYLTFLEKGLRGQQHSYAKRLQHLCIDLYHINKMYYYTTVEVLFYTNFKNKYTKQLVKPIKEDYILTQDQI